MTSCRQSFLLSKFLFTPLPELKRLFGNRALAISNPNIAQTKLDMKNAYGRASKATAVAEANYTNSKLAPTLANITQTEFLVWVQGDDGNWFSFPAYDGFVQGETMSNVGFCFNLRRALRTFATLNADTSQVQFKAYADDVFMYCKPDVLPAMLLLQQHLEKLQLTLEMPKCSAWVPAWHDINDEQRAAHPLISCLQ